VRFAVKAELTAGYELAFLPPMSDWHCASTTTLENLAIELAP
jgi:hypothetical protein